MVSTLKKFQNNHQMELLFCPQPIRTNRDFELEFWNMFPCYEFGGKDTTATYNVNLGQFLVLVYLRFIV